MYSTEIKQERMIDRTEQERLLLYFIVQKYYKMKGSNTERRNVHPVRKMMRLKQHRVTARRLCIPESAEKKRTTGRDIDR